MDGDWEERGERGRQDGGGDTIGSPEAITNTDRLIKIIAIMGSSLTE